MAFQKFNKRINAWVKMRDKKKGNGTVILDVKQLKPKVPFKGIKKKM